MTETEFRAHLKKAYDAGRTDALREGAATFSADSDDSPHFRAPFPAADAGRYADYFADTDGAYPGTLHRHFGMGPRAFAEASKLVRRHTRGADGRGEWNWVRRAGQTGAFADVSDTELATFAAILRSAPDPAAFLATVRRALRETNGDLGDALELASAVLAEDDAEWDEPAAAFALSKTGKVQKTITLVSTKGKTYTKTIWVNAPHAEPAKPDKKAVKAEAKEAASKAIGDAYADPASSDLGALAGHLKNLTVGELNALKKQSDLKGGGKKDDLIAKIVAHLKDQATPKPPPPPVPPKPSKADAKKAAQDAIAAAFANPADPVDMNRFPGLLKQLTVPELKALGQQHGAWGQKTKEKQIKALVGAFKTKQWVAQKTAKNKEKIGGTKHFDHIPDEQDSAWGANGTPSAQFKAEHPFADAKALKDHDVTGVPNHNLPDATRPPISDKAVATAINNYSWGYDGPMNAALRDTGAPPPGAFGGTKSGKPGKNGPEMFGNLQKAFAGTKPFGPPPVKVHRGIRFLSPDLVKNMEEAAKKAHASGGLVTMPGFISTSTSPSAASNFTGPVSFTIHANQGLDIQPYSHFPHEKELLLNHNCRYKVKGVTRTGSKIHIELEQVSGGLADKGAVALDGQKYAAGARTFAAWDEADHPRDDHGHFVSKDALAAAKGDPAKAAELRAKVTDPEQRAKLDRAIGGHNSAPTPTRGALPSGDELAQGTRVREFKPGGEVRHVRLGGKDFVVKQSAATAESGPVEALSADLAQIAGVNMPRAKMTTVNGQPALVQELVRGRALDKMGSSEASREALARVPKEELDRNVLFDYLAGNTDVHNGNYMVTDDGHLAAIDKEMILGRGNLTGQRFEPPRLLDTARPDGAGLLHTFDPATVLHMADAGDKMVRELESRGMAKQARHVRDRVVVLRELAQSPNPTAGALRQLGSKGVTPPGLGLFGKLKWHLTKGS